MDIVKNIVSIPYYILPLLCLSVFLIYYIPSSLIPSAIQFGRNLSEVSRLEFFYTLHKCYTPYIHTQNICPGCQHSSLHKKNLIYFSRTFFQGSPLQFPNFPRVPPWKIFLRNYFFLLSTVLLLRITRGIQQYINQQFQPSSSGDI